jgi:tol-pal system protein YbgF
MKRSLFLATICLALASGNACALFGDDKAHARIDEINARLAQIEAQLNTQLSATEQKSTQGVIELAGQIDQIRADIAQLRGQVEVLTYQVDEMQKRQRDLYADLDARLRTLEGGAPIASSESSAPLGGTVAPNPENEEQAYQHAMDLFKRGDYEGSATAFSAFVKTYPQSANASAAQYWFGNARFAQRNYRATVEAQTELLQKYPDSPKVPDAMLNLASAQTELGQRDAAQATLQTLIARYPNTDAANKAKQRLR